MPGLNWGAGSYFSPTETYAGTWPMKEALQQYLDEIGGSQAKGQGAIAGAQASDPVAAAYEGSAGAGPTAQGGPVQAFNNNAFANLIAGQRGARQIERSTNSGVRLNAQQGVENVGAAEGQDMVSQMQAQMEMNKAKEAAQATGIGGAIGLGDAFNTAGAILFDPANESGAFGKAQGPGAFLNTNNPQGTGIGGMTNGPANAVISAYTGVPLGSTGQNNLDKGSGAVAPSQTEWPSAGNPNSTMTSSDIGPSAMTIQDIGPSASMLPATASSRLSSFPPTSITGDSWPTLPSTLPPTDVVDSSGFPSMLPSAKITGGSWASYPSTLPSTTLEPSPEVGASFSSMINDPNFLSYLAEYGNGPMGVF